MFAVRSKPDTREKLGILSADAQYDLACACGSNRDEHRKRSADGRWIYPVTLPNGGRSTLFKTLISNQCTNDCLYCPLRADQPAHRCSLSPDRLAEIFLEYYNSGRVFGLFLTSAVTRSPDHAMMRLVDTASILRKKHQFRGYIHLKIIPGASPAAVEKAVSLSSAVSVNIETPGAEHLARLSKTKNYLEDIIAPIKQISLLTARHHRYSRVKQTTQFIVGAAGESDAQIVKYSHALYDRLNLHRIYFSSYQPGLGAPELPAEQSPPKDPHDALTREHRLYQTDFLLRKYKFDAAEIPFDSDGRLDLQKDPKQAWVDANPQYFPLDPNRATENQLLRVPGLGPVTVKRILKTRGRQKIRRLDHIAKPTKTLKKALPYLKF